MTEVGSGIEVRGEKGSPKGRSLHATRSFEPGDIIARFNSPAVVLPPGPRALEYCNHCLKQQRQEEPVPSTEKLRACTGCKTVAYCGPACQRANWSVVHKFECKAIQRLHKTKPADQPNWVPTPVRAAAQVMLRPKVMDKFEELEGNVELWRGKEMVKLQLQAQGVVRCLDVDEVSVELLESAFQVLCKLQTNAFSVSEDETDGVYLDTTLAMMNHSCSPNAMVQFDGRSASLRAMAFIESGDEVEISYIDETQPKSKRREHLRSYYFDCRCYKCIDDLDDYQIAQKDRRIANLNELSVTPDIERFKNPHLAEKDRLRQAIEVTKLLDMFPAQLRNMEPQAKHKWLREAYKSTIWFPKNGRWAIEPFAKLVDEAAVYFGKNRGNHECALAIACLTAYEIDPYKFPVPFHNERIRGLSAIAIALSQTAPEPEKLIKLARDLAAKKKFSAAGVRVLENLDQVSMCQMVLSLINGYKDRTPKIDWDGIGPYSWYSWHSGMIAEIESLPGRDRENSLINAWIMNPKGMDDFFRYALVKPVKALTELGKAVLDVDLGEDCDLSAN
ncbi:MYND finger [Colletotrichum phormii]|uniref:MYND finger n=1 Tax=Colletotrichum phormii TaxID=359342 RepID=A0AAJ0EGR7_9PEZI|nr:MYND finger [Colletotrichum phormii]KAK1638408.1 MYND finger [Colletotrichum phormii]